MGARNLSAALILAAVNRSTFVILVGTRLQNYQQSRFAPDIADSMLTRRDQAAFIF
jgi:hypothetical protein